MTAGTRKDSSALCEDETIAMISPGPVHPLDLLARALVLGFPRHDFDTAQRVLGVGLSGTAQDQAPIIDEPSSPAVGRAHGPEHECVQPRWSADRRPRIGVAGSEALSLERGVDEQLSVRRKIALLFIDAAAKPSARGKLIASGVPQDELSPRGWTSTEHHRESRNSRHDHEQSGGRHLQHDVIVPEPPGPAPRLGSQFPGLDRYHLRMVESPQVRAAPEVRTALRSLLPELADAPLRPAGAGDCFEAWWVADRYILRFAKGDAEHDASEALAVEMALLPTLTEVIDVQIPRPIRLGQDPATGRSVLVHEAVLGTPLLPVVWEDLSPAQRRAVAADVGRFVLQLQAVSIESTSVALPETRFHGVNDQPEAIERFVFNRMPASDVEVCRTLAREFEPCPPDRWVLVHGDLYDHHLLLAEDASLAGVIDFGDLARGDPACDLGTLMDDFGIEFVSDLLRGFPPQVVQERLERARFYCVWEALAWAAEELEAGPVEGMADHLHRVGELARAQLG
jgi:aminoglycoside 2''-phosphotransferase